MKMLRKKLCDILYKVQQSSSCHQKFRHILINVYNENPFEDFESEFMRCVELIFGVDIKCKNMHVERCMEFLATFVTTLAKTYENQSDDKDEDEFEIHPFLNSTIHNVLRYHNLEQVSARYRSCQFINLLLRHLGDDAHIDSDIASAIQMTMMKHLEDSNTCVRLQAVKALVRLQIPEEVSCPVMNALMGRLYESSAKVRKEIVESIAVIPTFIPRIIERVRDSDYNVRLTAYRKCALIGPKLITIANRRLIVNSGFTEEHGLVKKAFLEDMLPKWLNVYNGDYTLLLKALKFDAYEEDLKETESISKSVLEVFFKSVTLEKFLEFLPLVDKLVPVQKLTTELALFWAILVNFVRDLNDNEESLTELIPEMTHFCTYIGKVYEESKRQECANWRFLDFQQILCQLLKISLDYDYSDEVGRKAMQKLLHHLLLDGKFSSFVLTEVIFILTKINPIFDNLTIDICHIISDIHEPLVEKAPSEDVIIAHNFKIAELKVQIDILCDERDTAVAQADYELASKRKKQLTELNLELQKLTAPTESQKQQVKTTQNDAETLSRCLNILIALLSHPKLSSLTASLRSCKDEFVLPLLTHANVDVFSKAFKSVALFCLLDEQMLRDNLKLICSPIIAYRLMPQYDKGTLLVSIATISDTLRLYGTGIFADSNSDATLGTKRRLNGTRRLYSSSHLDNPENIDVEVLNCEEILFILVDMLDDENQELREYSGRSLCELVKNGIIVSPTIVSRLILKWFNPATERCDPKLQQLLGNTIVSFAQYVTDSEDVLEKAVIPILAGLGNAPTTSPLSDVNVDNAVEFLSAVTFIQKSSLSRNVHKNLAFALCHKIASRPEDRCVSLYIKMLANLELRQEKDPVVIDELINQTELISEEITDKNQKRNLLKLSGKLIEIRKRIGSSENTQERVTENSHLAETPAKSNLEACNDGLRLSIATTSARKSQNEIEEEDETVLHTIIEDPEPLMGSFHQDDTILSNVSNNSTMTRRSDRLRLQKNHQINTSSSEYRRNEKIDKVSEKQGKQKKNLTKKDDNKKTNENGDKSTLTESFSSLSSSVDSREAQLTSDSEKQETNSIVTSWSKKTGNKLRLKNKDVLQKETTNSVKRRKQRGKLNKENAKNYESKLHNDNSQDDVFIESPSSSQSQNTSIDSTEARKRLSRRVIVSDTSSDSDGKSSISIRRSLRKKQKKETFYF